MKSIIRKSIVLLLITAGGWYSATAQNLTVKITKTDNSEEILTAQGSLEAALSGVPPDSVASLEIRGGDFVAADWLWLLEQGYRLDKMTSFCITNEVNSVADIPNTSYLAPYFSHSVETLSVAKVKRIGNYAFEGTSLTSVSFPHATDVGERVFRECRQLANVSLPMLTELKEYTFLECKALTTISLPSLVSTGNYDFKDCINLTSVDMPVLTTLGYETFIDCSSLTDVNLPELTDIGNNAFSGCVALSSISFPKLKNVRSFSGCIALQSADLPLAETIESYAFGGCTALTGITAPRLTFVGDAAFEGCIRLGNLRLGATPPGAYTSSFAGCLSPRFLQPVDDNGIPLTGSELFAARTAYKAEDDGDTGDALWFGWQVDKDLYELSQDPAVSGGRLEPNYNFCSVETVVSITVYPEAGYRLKAGSLKVYKTGSPGTTVALDGYSFTMPAYAVTLTAQFETNNLQLTLNGSVSKNGVSLEDALKDVELSSITSLEITGGSFNTTDWLWLRDNKSGLDNVTHFTITSEADHVSDIPGATQSYFGNSLKSISVAGLVNIGNRAFYESRLASADFPHVKFIGNLAFCDAQSLATLNIPLVESIGSNVFCTCESLKVIDFQRLNRIGNYGFYSCSSLETVNLPKVEELGEGAFGDCTALTYIELPNATSRIENVFSGATSLVTASLPKVKELGSNAFDGCKSLVSVKAPIVEDISASDIFKDCSSLGTLLLGATPPTAGTVAFEGCPEARFIVPVSTGGERLTGTELSNALAAYKIVDDGNTADDEWYGWTLSANLHSVEVEAGIQNGRANLSPIFCTTGTTVTISAIPDREYKLKSLKAYKKGDLSTTITLSGATFTMPNYDVMVGVEFEPNSLTLTLNGSETKTGTSLENILSSVPLDSVISLEITGGDFLEADWFWLLHNRFNLDKMTSFSITDDINSVADIPNNPEYFSSYFSHSVKNIRVAKLKRIGYKAFCGGGFTDVSFPHVTDLEGWVFRECKQLANVSLPLVTVLKEYSFLECKALTTISLPSLVSTGYHDFKECVNLTSVDMPVLTTLGYETFIDCSSLTNANFPKLTSVGSRAFSGCTALQCVELPLAEIIESSAFSGCIALSTISIPKVTEIQNDAFKACTALNDITTPKLTSIDDAAFEGCIRLGNLRLGATPPSAYTSSFTACLTPRFLQPVDDNGMPLTGSELFAARTAYKADDDGDTSDALWFGWQVDKDLYEVNPDPAVSSGRLVPSYNFCPEGTTVNIIVNSDAGYRMVAGTLKAHKTGQPTKTVEISANSFTMPAYAVTLTAQFEANNLQLMLNGSTPKNGVSLEDALKDVELSTVTSLEITGGSFNVDDWLWLRSNRDQLNAIACFTITGGVSNVDNIPYSTQSYFGDSLQSISVAKLQRIGELAFYHTALISAGFPQVTEVGAQAFSCCSALNSVTLPEAATIEENAFDRCVALVSIELPKATTVKISAFNACTALKTASLPQLPMVEDNTFNGCTLLESILLPKATIIGGSAFYNCTKLASIGLPVVSEIQNDAFYACAALSTLQVGATPPTVGTDAFGAGAANRKLVFVNSNGTPLEGDPLSAARAAYKAVDDGNTTDNLWYGWEVELVVPTYNVNVAPAPNGTVNVAPAVAYAGTVITITVNPNAGYKLKNNSLRVYKTGDETQELTLNGLTFTMPAYDVTVTAEFEPGSSIISIEEDKAVALYPNPAGEILYIRGLTRPSNVQIFNSIGSLVFRQTVYPNNSLNISRLSTGVYIVKIDNNAALKLVVNK